MKTTSLLIANYCVPCHAYCRYCLLASCGKATGVDYKAGEALAGRIIREMKDARPDLHCSYYIGYCMDTPELPKFLSFSREYQAPAAKFLQMNGFAFRSDQELTELMEDIREAGVELNVDIANEVSARTPNLCHLAPAGPTYMEDLNEAGGVYAVMNELSKKNLLNLDCLTCTGKTVGENIKGCEIRDPQVIRPLDNPYSETGGLAHRRGGGSDWCGCPLRGGRDSRGHRRRHHNGRLRFPVPQGRLHRAEVHDRRQGQDPVRVVPH